MTTAVNDAIGKLKKSIEQEIYIINNPKGYDDSDISFCYRNVNITNMHIKILESLLEKEKQQIIQAYDHSEIMTGEFFQTYNNGEEYYNNNFK